MDSWQAELAASLSSALGRAANAAVDIEVLKRTGVASGPTFAPNAQVSTVPLAPGQAGVIPAGGLPSWVPVAAVVLAVALVVYRIAK